MNNFFIYYYLSFRNLNVKEEGLLNSTSKTVRNKRDSNRTAQFVKIVDIPKGITNLKEVAKRSIIRNLFREGLTFFSFQGGC